MNPHFLLRETAHRMASRYHAELGHSYVRNRIRYVLVEATFHPDNQRNTQFQDLCDFLLPVGFKVRGIHDQSTFGGKTYLTCVNALFLLQDA